MVKQITIERFKSIESATLDLGKINPFGLEQIHSDYF